MVFAIQINLICFTLKLFLSHLLSGDVRKINVSEILSWLFILNYLYGKLIFVLHCLIIKILRDSIDLSGLLVTAFVFQSVLFSALVTWFEKGQNSWVYAKYFRLCNTHEVRLSYMSFVVLKYIFFTYYSFKAICLRKNFILEYVQSPLYL